MKTRNIFWIILLAVIYSISLAQGDNEQDDVAGSAPSEETSKPAAKSGQTRQQKDTPRGNEDFTPTEEISEDISVPFPVDI